MGPLAESFTSASRLAAAESRATARRLAAIPDEWSDLLGPVRAGSVTARLLALLPTRPVLSAEEAGAAVQGPVRSVYAAIDRLRQAQVLRPLTDRKRNQIWGASLILAELDDIGRRIARAAN